MNGPIMSPLRRLTMRGLYPALPILLSSKASECVAPEKGPRHELRASKFLAFHMLAASLPFNQKPGAESERRREKYRVKGGKNEGGWREKRKAVRKRWRDRNKDKALKSGHWIGSDV